MLILVVVLIGYRFLLQILIQDKDIAKDLNTSELIVDDENGYENASITELVEFTLSLINEEREKENLPSLRLSEINNAESHAENMLKNGYFSHWSLEGKKPYMRYSELGGNGLVTENIGRVRYSTGFDLKKAINHSLHQMLFEDDDWNWIHRENILDPLHNKVGIGIAYNDTSLYIVQDFEQEYFDQFKLTKEVNRFHLIIDPEERNWVPTKIQIQYDPKPTLLSLEKIKEAPYSGTYDSGTYAATVFPKTHQETDVFPVLAEKWVSTQYTFEAIFDLTTVFEKHGEGVYTLYILESGRFWSSKSIWYGN